MRRKSMIGQNPIYGKSYIETQRKANATIAFLLGSAGGRRSGGHQLPFVCLQEHRIALVDPAVSSDLVSFGGDLLHVVGYSFADTEGTKKVAFMCYLSSRSRMRFIATRLPYSPWESPEGLRRSSRREGA